jgi:hypothetical protein
VVLDDAEFAVGPLRIELAKDTRRDGVAATAREQPPVWVISRRGFAGVFQALERFAAIADDVAYVTNCVIPALGDWHPTHADAELVTELVDYARKFFAYICASMSERVADGSGYRTNISVRVPVEPLSKVFVNAFIDPGVPVRRFSRRRVLFFFALTPRLALFLFAHAFLFAQLALSFFDRASRPFGIKITEELANFECFSVHGGTYQARA